jgi:hypothetical protein
MIGTYMSILSRWALDTLGPIAKLTHTISIKASGAVTPIRTLEIKASSIFIARMQAQFTLIQVNLSHFLDVTTGSRHCIAIVWSDAAIAVYPAHCLRICIPPQQPPSGVASKFVPGKVSKNIARGLIILAHLDRQRVPSIISLYPVLDHSGSSNMYHPL